MQNQVLPISPGLVARSTWAAVISLVMTLPPKGGQAVQVGVNLKLDAAPMATIPPVWTAAGDIFFAAEMHHAIPAFA